MLLPGSAVETNLGNASHRNCNSELSVDMIALNL